MAPPLRSRADVEACRAALADGVIDAIATDHAPHAVHEKEQDFQHAPHGILGLETAFSVCLELVRDEVLTPLELVRCMSTTPARLLGLAAGTLREGADGDVVVLSPDRQWTYDPAKGYSKSRNSPWAGTTFRGRVEATLVQGELVYHADRGVLVD
jgi:dihydroorotase